MRGLGARLGFGSGKAAVVVVVTLGNEIWVQPAFDASTGITLNGWTVAGGVANCPPSANFMSATALETLTPGTYRINVDITANPNGNSVQVFLGGTVFGSNGAGFVLSTGPAFVSKDIVVTAVTDQLIRVRDSAGDGGFSITAFSVKRLG